MVEGQATGTRPPLRLVCFAVRQQEFAFPIADVRETLPLAPISHVFMTPPWLAGIFSLRGEIVPAIDLAVLLGLAPLGPSSRSDAHSETLRSIAGGANGKSIIEDSARIVIVDHRGVIAGILVERLCEL